MAIDILSIEPTVISRDLKGKYVLLYGLPKSGKTTFASKFPNNLILGFERGYNFLPGVKAQDITKWSDFKLVLRQLKRPEAQELYNTITIDTVPIAFNLCEKYVCSKHGVESIADISWGQGWTELKREFEDSLREITMLGYGLVLISHSKSRIEKDAEGNEREIISVDMPKRAAEVCNGLVDIIAYIGEEYEGNESKRYLYTRSTPYLFAGSRLKYLASKIPLSYNGLVNAIVDAIEQEGTEGATIVDHQERTEVQEYTFEELMKEAETLWIKLIEENETYATTILNKIKDLMGRDMRLSEFTERQKDFLQLIIIEMRAM